MSLYGPEELNTELNRIEEAALQPSSSSNAREQSLNRVRAYFADQDPNLQAKRVILQQRLTQWRQGNAELVALARDLEPLAPIQRQAAPSLFNFREDYVPFMTSEEKAEAEQKEVRNKEAEKQFTIFEEYRRLSYHLNREDKIDGERIRQTDPKSGYDFIVKAPDNNGNDQLYFAKRIKTTHDDLVPFILIPQDQSKQPCEVRLTFQGTSSLNGWYRNFTGQGSAGIADFNANKAAMITQLAEEIAKIPGDVNLSIIGHSLGGADAQNMMTEVMRVIDSGKEPRLNKIKGLSLYAYNSAGVTEKTKKESLVLAKRMHERGIDISAHFSIVGGDIVQQTGDANILIGLPRSDGRFVLVKTQAGQEGVYQGVSSAYAAGWATLDAHVGQIFTPKEQGGALEQVQSREFFFNNDEAGLRAIQEKCGQHKLAQKMPWTYYIGQLSKGMTKVAGRRLWEGTSQDLDKLVDGILTEKYFMESEATADLITEIIGLQPALVKRFFELNQNGTSFFIECAKQGRADIVSALSNHQSLISQKDSSGKTALLYAIENGHNDCVAVLVSGDFTANRSLISLFTDHRFHFLPITDFTDADHRFH